MTESRVAGFIEELQQRFGPSERMGCNGQALVIPNHHYTHETAQRLQGVGLKSFTTSLKGQVVWVVPLNQQSRASSAPGDLQPNPRMVLNRNMCTATPPESRIPGIRGRGFNINASTPDPSKRRQDDPLRKILDPWKRTE